MSKKSDAWAKSGLADYYSKSASQSVVNDYRNGNVKTVDADKPKKETALPGASGNVKPPATSRKGPPKAGASPMDLSKKAYDLSEKAKSLDANPKASFTERSNAHGKAMLAHGKAHMAFPLGSEASKQHYRASEAHLNKRQPATTAADTAKAWDESKHPREGGKFTSK